MSSIIKSISKHISFLELIKWIAIGFLLILSVVECYILCNCSLFIRRIVFCMTLIAAGSVALMTKLGHSMVLFSKEAYIELRKVVWPTYQDSLNTTLIVVVVTVIISLILWGFDTILVYIISLGLRL